MNVKRCLSIFVVLCMLLSSLAVFTLTATAEAINVTDTTTKVVSVYNKATETTEELTLGAFMTAAASSDFSGKELTLLENISLAGVSQSIPNFAGVLNGNNKTISDLSAPLFATLTGATVKDLTLAGSIESTATTVGALANTTTATAEEGGVVTVQNCVNNVAVKGTCSTAAFYVAGFIGQANDDLTFISCVNNGNVSSESAKGTSMGGFVGQTKADASIKLNLTACINNGAITAATGNQQALNGGLVGESKCTLTVKKCVNSGAVSTTSTVAGGGHKMGGIVAYNAKGTATFEACVNNGKVTSYRIAGGMIGQCDSTLTVSHCINNAEITTGGDATVNAESNAGGIVGYMNGTATILSSVNYQTITAKSNNNDNVFAGGIVSQGLANATIESCINRGTLVSDKSVQGGFLGCQNKTDKTVTVSNCLSVGTYEFVGKVAKGTANVGDSNMKDEANWKAAQAVVYKGYQTRLDTSDFEIRLVVGLNSLNYENTGFLVYAIEEEGSPKSMNKNTNTVYTALNAYSTDGSITVNPITAESQDCNYLSAITISGIPTQGAVTLVIKPYVTAATSETESEIVYGYGAVIEIVDGVIVSQNAY